MHIASRPGAFRPECLSQRSPPNPPPPLAMQRIQHARKTTHSLSTRSVELSRARYPSPACQGSSGYNLTIAKPCGGMLILLCLHPPPSKGKVHRANRSDSTASRPRQFSLRYHLFRRIRVAPAPGHGLTLVHPPPEASQEKAPDRGQPQGQISTGGTPRTSRAPKTTGQQAAQEGSALFTLSWVYPGGERTSSHALGTCVTFPSSFDGGDSTGDQPGEVHGNNSNAGGACVNARSSRTVAAPRKASVADLYGVAFPPMASRIPRIHHKRVA